MPSSIKASFALPETHKRRGPCSCAEHSPEVMSMYVYVARVDVAWLYIYIYTYICIYTSYMARANVFICHFLPKNFAVGSFHDGMLLFQNTSFCW